jgi:hypothetical protein
VQALRLVDDARADALLAGVLDADPATEVRLTVLEAARDRAAGSALLAATVRALAATDAHLRYQAVLTLAVWLPARPELRAPLTTIARADQQPRVRAAASAALSSYRNGTGAVQ